MGMIERRTDRARRMDAARPLADNVAALSATQVQLEWFKCFVDVGYFTWRYGWLYNATEEAWLRFQLWPAQAMTLRRMADERMLVVLKARQLGLSWLCLAYALWLLIYHPPATVLLFSLRESEAVELLERMRGMYARLPRWMQARHVLRQSRTIWSLSNGSRALAFSTKAGRSYTGTLALVDEADFVPELGHFLNGVKPTIDAGGKLYLVSTSDKRRPVSPFKRLFRAAMQGVGDYRALFLPWQSHPGRDAVWYERTKAEMFAQRGTDDDFFAEYPAAAEEALAPEQLDRRFPYEWLKEVLDEMTPLPHATHVCVAMAKAESAGPALAGLTVYVAPKAGHQYVIGVDPAEGNPNSDDSVATVLDAQSWAEVATLVGKFEPGSLTASVDVLGGYYNQADALVERNNHGHTVIRGLLESGKTRVIHGYDGKAGWLTNIKGKPLMFDALAEAIRDRACVVRSIETISQLASIEASTLRAPEGLHDDRAMAFALAVAALAFGHGKGEASASVPPVDPLARIDQERW